MKFLKLLSWSISLFQTLYSSVVKCVCICKNLEAIEKFVFSLYRPSSEVFSNRINILDKPPLVATTYHLTYTHLLTSYRVLNLFQISLLHFYRLFNFVSFLFCIFRDVIFVDVSFALVMRFSSATQYTVSGLRCVI